MFWKIVEREVTKQNTSFEWLYVKTKIPKGTFSSWRSRNTLPGVEQAYKIAEALGVSVEYLLTGTDGLQHASNTDVQKIAEMLACFDKTDLLAVQKLVEVLYERYLKSSKRESSQKATG